MNKIKPSHTQPGNNPKKATNTKNSSRCPEHRDTLNVNTAIKCVNAGRLNTRGVGALKKKWFFSVSMRMRRIKCARIQWGESQSPRRMHVETAASTSLPRISLSSAWCSKTLGQKDVALSGREDDSHKLCGPAILSILF